ncbi:MAG: polysaccharide deacetylase family protein [Oscillospiraceae bacterium]
MFCCVSKQHFYRLLGCVLCAAAALTAILALTSKPDSITVSTQEWGLSFQEKNEPPVPNLSAEELLPYNTYYCGTSGQKRIYLTFDAGFENGNMPIILDALKKHNATGAFFVVSPFIKENPELVKRMVSEGHFVCNHTHHHPNMSQKDEASFCRELTDVEEAYFELIGKPMLKFYRPPEGKFNNENLQWAKSLGYKTVLWSLAYKDWVQTAQPSHEDAINKILSRTHDDAIVLLHSTSSTNAAIMDELLTEWESLGYSFGTLNELGAVAQ